MKTERDDTSDLTENQKEQKLAREAADRATKTLAKSIAEEAEKKIKLTEREDQSLLKEQTKAAREAVAEQARLAKEAALLKREAEKVAWKKKQREQAAQQK